MKKFLLVAALCVAQSTFSNSIFDQINTYFNPEPVPHVETPKVIIQEIIDPINFKTVMTNLVMHAKDQSIQGIILLVDSYGGTMSQFSALHDLIKKVAAIKPVVAFVTSSALSGGYMIACAADYIIAPSCSNIGFIGVIKEINRYTNPKIKTPELTAQLDVTLIKAGKYKTLGSPFGEQLTDEDRAYLSENLQKSYQLFLNLVAHNRKLDIARASEWAEAKVFVGPEAIEVGLVDQIGTYFDAESKIVELIRAKNPDKQYTNTIIPVFA